MKKRCGILKIPKYWYQQKNAILQISTLSFQTNLLLCQILNRSPKAVSKFKIKFGTRSKKWHLKCRINLVMQNILEQYSYNIRSHHECEGRTEKSVPSITIGITTLAK